MKKRHYLTKRTFIALVGSHLLFSSARLEAATDPRESAEQSASDGKASLVDRSKEENVPVVESGCLAQSDTEFRFSLPGWITGLQGDFGVAGVVSDQDVKFTDILRRLDMIAVGSLYARWHRWEAFADGQYLRISDDAKLPGLLFTDAHLALKTAFAEGFIGYRVINCQQGVLSLFAGARYNYMSADMTIRDNGDPRFPILRQRLGIPDSLKLFGEIDWVDPVVGLSGKVKLAKAISFYAKGDMGGFGAASDFTWEVYGGIECQVTRHLYSTIGWRYLKNDYVSGGFTNKTELNGPFLETGFNF